MSPAGGPSGALIALVGELIERAQAAAPGTLPVIAIVGAQGSGKTTLARAAAEAFGAVQVSIDDVYLTRMEREALSREAHPLLLMRGPPGTHDLSLMEQLIDSLARAGPDDATLIPDFDKRGDDRWPVTHWREHRGRARAVLIDAWCLGALAVPDHELAMPINALEQQHDRDGRWRSLVNGKLAGPYARFAQQLGGTLFLRAPGFEVVHRWRCQQEADLLGVAPDALPAHERDRLAGFIQYFERVTRQMLDGHVAADVVVQLDEHRRAGGPLWRGSAASV